MTRLPSTALVVGTALLAAACSAGRVDVVLTTRGGSSAPVRFLYL